MDNGYAYDADAAEEFLYEMKTQIDKIKAKVSDYEGIVSLCENGWTGLAKEEFVKKFTDGAKDVNDNLDTVYERLKNTIDNVQAVMK